MFGTLRQEVSILYCLAVLAILLISIPRSCNGQPFDTVINIPMDPNIGDNGLITSNTQLNLLDGGSIGSFFNAGEKDGSSTNIEVNILGGSVGDQFMANSGSTINIAGGVVDGIAQIVGDSTVNLSGDAASEILVVVDSTANISGGVVERRLIIKNSSVANITGGAIHEWIIALGGENDVNISGGQVDGNIRLDQDSELNISGGRVSGRIETRTGSRVNISGGNVGSVELSPEARLAISAGALSGFVSLPGSRADISGDALIHFASVRDGSVVNMTSGKIRNADRMTINGQFNLSGGLVSGRSFSDDGLTVGARGELNMVGGTIGSKLYVQEGGPTIQAVVNIAGGTLADGFVANENSRVNLFGGEYRLDGEILEELDQVGNSLQLNAPIGSLLSGTFADGTPFAFYTSHNDGGDKFGDGVLVLNTVTLPDIAAPEIVVSAESPLQGVRAGQTIVINEGGSLGDYFNAGHGSKVLVKGGQIGSDFEALGAEVEIFDGEVNYRFDAFPGTKVKIHGGTIHGGFRAWKDSHVDVLGGTIERSFAVHKGSSATQAGGTIGPRATVSPGGELTIAGGTIGRGIEAYLGSIINFRGSDFRFEGEPIDGLINVGDEVTINKLPHGVFTGVLADGTPFAFRNSFLSATLGLKVVTLPEIGPELIVASTDPVPLGIREGQVLRVDDGGSIANHFNAGFGSTVYVEAGGAVGEGLEAVGTQVNILGGEVGDFFGALQGSLVVISGGTIGDDSYATNGSEVFISSGSIGSSFSAYEGSKVMIKGGSIADRFVASFGSQVFIEGGSIGEFFNAGGGSNVTISGGSFSGKFIARRGGAVNFIGTEFTLDGVDITEELSSQVPLTIFDRNKVLAGIFADGTPFSFWLGSVSGSNQSYFDLEATVSVRLIPEPAALALALSSILAMLFVRRRDFGGAWLVS